MFEAGLQRKGYSITKPGIAFSNSLQFLLVKIISKQRMRGFFARNFLSGQASLPAIRWSPHPDRDFSL
jgi:hypothetical protein